VPGLQDIPNEHVYHIPVAAHSAGTGAGNEVVLGGGAFRAPFNGVVTKAYFVPSAAVSHSATHFVTLALHNEKADASGTAKPATRVWSAGDSVAQVADTMTLDATLANTQFAAGDILIPTAADNDSTGLALPAGTMVVHVEWR